MRIAVIGSGVAGLGAAWLLSQEHTVDLYEAEDRLGGHAHTSDVEVDGRTVPIDTGFMVFNYRTYPHLTSLFALLGVDEFDAEMTFSVQCAFDRLEWAGHGKGYIAQPRNLLRPKYWKMVYDVFRFSFAADRLLAETSDDTTLGELLDQERMGPGFREWYFVPMSSAIWSTRPVDMVRFPAATFLRFMDNHGLLHVGGKPQWKSVVGGSRNYVKAVADAVSGEVHLGQPVLAITRMDDKAHVATAHAETIYDAAVVATHPAEALKMLTDPTPEETDILGSFSYQANPTIVHTDERFLPTRKWAHAAWNYFAESGDIGSDRLSVTYYLNRLQKLDCDTPVLVTLNSFVDPDPAKELFRIDYEHPTFDMRAIQAQARVPSIQGAHKTWYCGAWQRYGFHEDGMWSAVRVAESMGVPIPWAEELARRAAAETESTG